MLWFCGPISGWRGMGCGSEERSLERTRRSCGKVVRSRWMSASEKGGGSVGVVDIVAGVVFWELLLEWGGGVGCWCGVLGGRCACVGILDFGRSVCG